MLGCDQVKQELSDYVDKAIPLRRRLAIGVHLLLCRGCSTLLRSLRATITTLHSLRDHLGDGDGTAPPSQR